LHRFNDFIAHYVKACAVEFISVCRYLYDTAAVQRCWRHTTMKTFTCLTVHDLSAGVQRTCVVTLATETMLQVG